MFKVIAISLIDSWSHTSTYNTIEEANSWIASQNNKLLKWDKFYGPRSIPKDILPENLAILVESEEEKVVFPETSYYDENNQLVVTPAEKQIWVNLKAEYAVTIEDITSQYEAEKKLKDLVLAGENDANCCADIRALIGGYNKERNLSLEQIQQMIQSFSLINELLLNQMPGTAKSVMLGITPDEIVTQELIDLCMVIFNKYNIE